MAKIYKGKQKLVREIIKITPESVPIRDSDYFTFWWTKINLN